MGNMRDSQKDCEILLVVETAHATSKIPERQTTWTSDVLSTLVSVWAFKQIKFGVCANVVAEDSVMVETVVTKLGNVTVLL
jgi:hypothetical protein